MNRHQDHTSGLVRGIRRWDLVALFINGVIGAGIFGLPATVYRLTGTCSLLAYAICAFLVVLIVLCFAELGSRFNETGGPYLYTRRAFGPIVGFEVGWLLWLARLTAFAALCNLFVQYLAYFVPVVADPAGRAITITLIVLTLTTVNIVGVRASALVGDVFTVAKLIPLVLFAVAGLCFMRGENFLLQPTPTFADLSKA
ncbi:MAG: APC family permease, partial [Tepidisphaeraceae bacterium]